MLTMRGLTAIGVKPEGPFKSDHYRY